MFYGNFAGMKFWNDMVVSHVIPEIHKIILEMHFSAFMYFWIFMAENHVILAISFADILQVCNFGSNGCQPRKSAILHIILEICYGILAIHHVILAIHDHAFMYF